MNERLEEIKKQYEEIINYQKELTELYEDEQIEREQQKIAKQKGLELDEQLEQLEEERQTIEDAINEAQEEKEEILKAIKPIKSLFDFAKKTEQTITIKRGKKL